MQTYEISLWIEDASTGETSYKEIRVTATALGLEGAVQEEIERLPAGTKCDGWSKNRDHEPAKG